MNTFLELLNLEPGTTVESWSIEAGVPWASRFAFWGVLICSLVAFSCFTTYIRFEPTVSRWLRIGLAGIRTLAIALLVVTLLEPRLSLVAQAPRPPKLLLVFDGTESMLLPGQPKDDEDRPASRIEQIREALADPNGSLQRIVESGRGRIEAWRFRGDAVTALAAGESGAPDWSGLAEQLTASGAETALGPVARQLTSRVDPEEVSAAIVFSDFVDNADRDLSEIEVLPIPVIAVGVGPLSSTDVTVRVPKQSSLKQGAETTLEVQMELRGRQPASVNLVVSAESLANSEEITLYNQLVPLVAGNNVVSVPFVPDEAGDLLISATASGLNAESNLENNSDAAVLQVVDDGLRVLSVAYEPAWEWRFLKDFLLQSDLVGPSGYRAFLENSAPRVRKTNPLFLETLPGPRNEFLSRDVILLGDVPRELLTDPLTSLLREFVGDLGGSLVMLSGPRFGPGVLQGTGLEEMLPVLVDSEGKLRETEFQPQVTRFSANYPFMHLSDSGSPALDWQRLGRLPWYQPVRAVQDQSLVLLEHPTDRCEDGITPQPLMVLRRFGRGEVLFLSFNETWRLRRGGGEKYFQVFWSELLHGLANARDRGEDRRFAIQVEQRQESQVAVLVRALDEEFLVLNSLELSAKAVFGDSEASDVTEFTLTSTGDGRFLGEFQASHPGRYRIEVQDPVTQEAKDKTIVIERTSEELNSLVRDQQLQQRWAASTGGHAISLDQLNSLPDLVDLEPRPQTQTIEFVVWTNWTWLVVVLLLFMLEWTTRRLYHLR